MPIEDLLAMYGYSNGDPPSSDTTQGSDSRSSSEEEILSNQDLTLDKEEIARDLLSNSEENEDKETDVHDLLESMEQSQTARLLRSKSQADSEESDSEADIDYKPERDEDWKKTIQVGSSFQAVVPEGLSMYGDAPAYENEDRLLWDPSKIDDEKVDHYLEDIQVQCLNNAVGVNAIPTGAHIRDDEQSLYLLLQCGHNVEEALRRRKMQAIPPTDPMSLWSEEECSNFETGLKFYGKDFFHIHQNKVKTRSIGELVQFYYLWKKTERHDIFANKTRLEKRRYTLHPGVTDYMDRFLDDQENPPPPPPRDRSASPIHSLLYGDPKRNHLKPHTDPAAGDCPPTFQPIPSEMDVNTASPTVKGLSPDCISRNPGHTNSESYPIVNGVSEDSFSPPLKKSKLDTVTSSDSSELCNIPLESVTTTASTAAQNHVDSLAITSVDKISVSEIEEHSLSSASVSAVEIENLRTPEAVSQ